MVELSGLCSLACVAHMHGAAYRQQRSNHPEVDQASFASLECGIHSCPMTASPWPSAIMSLLTKPSKTNVYTSAGRPCLPSLCQDFLEIGTNRPNTGRTSSTHTGVLTADVGMWLREPGAHGKPRLTHGISDWKLLFYNRRQKMKAVWGKNKSKARGRFSKIKWKEESAWCRRELETQSQQTWVRVPALPPASYAPLGGSFNNSSLQFWWLIIPVSVGNSED